MAKFCMECGKPVFPGAKFCAECGAALPAASDGTPTVTIPVKGPVLSVEIVDELPPPKGKQ